MLVLKRRAAAVLAAAALTLAACGTSPSPASSGLADQIGSSLTHMGQTISSAIERHGQP